VIQPVTMMFVVGYSWVDGHTYQTANQGEGAGLAGRRALLVIIGFTAAFIIMFFPRPNSARQIVRRNLAKSLAAAGELYAQVITALEEEDGHGQTEEETEERLARFRSSFLKIMGRMQGIQQQMGFASAEPGLKGPWPKHTYQDIVMTEGALLSSLALLSSAYARLNPQWCKMLVEKAEIMNPAFIADCLALFTLLEQSLKTGDALPPTIPIFERLAYHGLRRRVGSGPSTVRGQKEVDDRESDGTGEDDGLKREVRGRTQRDADRLSLLENEQALENLDSPLTWDVIHDEQMASYATANVALVHLAGCLNELQRLVIKLVGERELSGFDRAQERMARTELEV